MKKQYTLFKKSEIIKMKAWNFYIYWVNKLIMKISKQKYVCHDCGDTKHFQENTLHLNPKANIFICVECVNDTIESSRRIMRNIIFGKK